MKKRSVIIKSGDLVNLIFEAIGSRRNAEQIKFVTSDVGNVNFVEYFDVNPKAVKKFFLMNGGDIVASFLGLNKFRINFNLLNKLSSNNLSAKEYYKCDFGTLELWMFFSSSKTYGDKSFYMMATLKGGGKDYKGVSTEGIKADHYIMTSLLSSKNIGIAIVDLLSQLYHEVCGLNLNVGTPKKKEMSFF